jgi:hypothetical protein
LEVLLSLILQLQFVLFEISLSAVEDSFSLHPQQHSVISQHGHPVGIACTTTGNIQTESKRTAEMIDNFLKDFIFSGFKVF